MPPPVLQGSKKPGINRVDILGQNPKALSFEAEANLDFSDE